MVTCTFLVKMSELKESSLPFKKCVVIHSALPPPYFLLQSEEGPGTKAFLGSHMTYL